MSAWQRSAAALIVLLGLAPLAVGVEEGERFPAFQLDRADGSTWRSADHAEQPKIVLFWATWCPYCRKLMPGIVALHEEYSARGLEVVGVNFRDEDGDTEAYAESMDIEFDIVVDGDDLATAVGVRGTPTLFVLDRHDRVVLRLSDSDPENPELREAVEALMPPIAPAADPRIGVFRSDVPYPSRYVEVKGHRLHYLDEGDGQTPDTVGSKAAEQLSRRAESVQAGHGEARWDDRFHEHDATHAVLMLPRIVQTQHRSPVMHHEDDVVEIKRVNEALEELVVGLVRVVELRLVGETEADVVEGDDSAARRYVRHDVAPQIARRGIAVQKQDGARSNNLNLFQEPTYGTQSPAREAVRARFDEF